MASQLETNSRSSRLAAIVALAVCLLASGVAFADTVYLKNGRTMRATRVEVLEDEGRVVLEQGANRVVIPLSLVERIVKDDEESVVLEPGTGKPPLPPAAGSDGKAEAGEEGEQPAAGADQAEEVPPEETRAYWQDAVRSIEEEKAQLQSSLEGLRREERAFLFSHRSTADTKAKIEAVQSRLKELDQSMEDLRRDARRQGIPPGWLRLDRRSVDSGQRD